VKSFARFVLRRAGLIAIAGTLLTFGGAYYSVLLYKNLRTDLEELLPTTARSVRDLNEVTHRLESIDSLAILIFSDKAEPSRRFVDALAAKLEKAPKSTIASVEYKISRELEFFRKRRALYMDLDDLKKVRDYINDRIEYEKKLYNPLNIFSGVDFSEPKLDFDALKNKYEGKVSAYSRFPGGYYATPDETKRVILAYMPGKSSGVGNIHKLRKYVDQAISELDPKSFDPGMTIRFAGGVQNTIEEQAALVADLELSTILTILVVAIAMYFFYRTGRCTAALLTSLMMGTLWTFGASYFAVGYLNANSAFLGSIVIGNGINFPIILLARYLEERRAGRDHDGSLITSMVHTAKATWTAAGAAGLAYGSLMLTSFRGFNQFGVIGLIGMLLCWISAFTMLPAFLTVMDRRRSLAPRGKHPRSYIALGIAHLVTQRPRLIWGVSLLITAVSAISFVRFTPDIIEANLKKLRNKQSMTSGSGYLSRYVDEIFQRYLSPMVILPREPGSAREIARILKSHKETEEANGEKSLIASVQTIDDFVPPSQPEKISVLHQIRDILPNSILRRLSPKERELVGEFLTLETLKPFTMKQLPELILNKFREKDGTIGKMVLVAPPVTQETLNRVNLSKFVSDIRAAGDEVEPGAPLAGSLPVSSDMLDSISRDGPRATLFAFLAVVLLVIAVFREPKIVTLTLFALIMGVLWMAGIIFIFGIRINFLSFIALPITFGIGVDYGVNIFERYREEGSKNIIKVLRDTGGAVLLCSFTTVVGYGSLLIAQNQAFVSFGLLAVLGEATCLAAAILALPAFLLTREKKLLAAAKARTQTRTKSYDESSRTHTDTTLSP